MSDPNDLDLRARWVTGKGVSAEALQVRIEEHGRRISEIERTQPAVTARDVEVLSQDLEELRAELRRDFADFRDEVRSLKRALYMTSLSVTGGVVVWAFTAFQLWGGGG